jgi:preprotein translocase subunit SecF
VWFSISSIIIGLGVFTLFFYGLPLGIDFTGGTEMRITFLTADQLENMAEDGVETSSLVEGEEMGAKDEAPEQGGEVEEMVETEEVVTEISAGGGAEGTPAESPVREQKKEITILDIENVLSAHEEQIGVPMVFTSDEQGFVIRTKDIDDALHLQIKSDLKEQLGEFEETSFMTIGPTVGSSLKQKAIVAVIIAIIGIILFIAYSFRKVPKRINPWRFSITAIIALVHDIIITVGVFAALSHFLGYEANSLFITALLTILGYSINDTIVVFDRIRENLKYQERGETFADIANKSLNQTLSRSINTSFTTLISLIFLFLFGGETIKFFVLTLIIGFSVGTYSSIFIATPLLVHLRNRVGNG